jgi:hypothetical protein
MLCLKKKHLRIAASTVAICFQLPIASAITLGQVDEFQSGTQGWLPVHVASLAANGGPGGLGDTALNVRSDMHFVVYNQTRWTGDFVAAGVSQIVLDVLNRTSTTLNPAGFDLALRIGVANGRFGSAGSGDTYVTKYAINVPNDGQWHNVAFSVRPSDFTPSAANTSPTPNAAAALAQVTQLRILHNPAANDYRGAVTPPAEFRLDNITAMAGGSSADFDQNGLVDGADFMIWQRGLGGAASLATGDADRDGLVDGRDLAVWKSMVPDPSPMSAYIIAEPAAGYVKMVIGLAAVFVAHRRQHLIAM